jgi:hypothetical protein
VIAPAWISSILIERRAGRFQEFPIEKRDAEGVHYKDAFGSVRKSSRLLHPGRHKRLTATLVDPRRGQQICCVNEQRPSQALPRQERRDIRSRQRRFVTLNGKRSVLPQHGGSKEIGKGLWQAILKQLDIKD